ncbi:hypothetical protein AJ80_08235 [Polytolypa hystricis UAMH7299]|uniref:Kinesin motor domain-containing protein n=1 Tax=Polytolypa hystricis (strain UAMH7299) TaxID=1447883 RepID=A0A2B7XBI9_POLH7|nr:hypothetical protein AJ80_08235 [Polytolypa hystricis UAMH7299]
MEPPPKPAQTSLFQVYLRLRPPISQTSASQASKSEGYLTVESPEIQSSDEDSSDGHVWPTHITVQPPNDSRKRAVEKFAFTKVFEEHATQLDLFEESGMVSMINSVLSESRDGLVATLGVTGSGKTHTMLGSKSQRGITQMSLDVVFRSLASTICDPESPSNPHLLSSIAASDPSDAHLFSARAFLDGIYGDVNGDRGRISRAQTPMASTSRSQTPMTESASILSISRRHLPHRPSALPQVPDVSDFVVPMTEGEEHVVLISMYEVYNDRIYDLLSSAHPGTVSRTANSQKDRRRHLLFKPTESSPDRKVVAGLRKIVCSTYDEALMVLETGLMERRVTGTGSNSVSSRSHGFFCVEVKKRIVNQRFGGETWLGNSLSIVDLAGSERARNAKTAGATLAEAGKINESLMYLGQCLQMQTGLQDGNKQTLVPFRQCKLTELLFSNSIPSSHQSTSSHKIPQKAIMIVAADPQGDFNATSQILRYSALAREVTVPRIPSVSSTILASQANASKAPSNNGRSPIFSASAEELETAALEISRLTDDYDALIVKLAEEEIAREEAELRYRAAEEKCMLVEQEVREECWEEMEQQMDEERKRWQTAWDDQATRHEEHLDKKVDLLSRGINIHEDPEPSDEERILSLETENQILRSRLAALEREVNSRSPTKKMKPKKSTMPGRFNSLDYSYASESDVENVIARKLDRLRIDQNATVGSSSPSTTPTMMMMATTAATPKKVAGKKYRALTSRKRDLGPESLLDEYQR